MLAPVTVQLMTELDRSINEVAQLTTYMLLVIACLAYVYSILSRAYGKRPFFLFSMVLLVVADVWGACYTSYDSMYGARILSGIGQAMFEALSLAVVPDLYFVHERGTRIALFIFFSQTGVTLGTPIVTQIATRFGLKSAFVGLAVSEAIMLVAMFFFMYETAYSRRHVDALAHQNEREIMSQVHGEEKATSHTFVESVQSPDTNVSSMPKKTYLQQLKPFQGKVSSYNLFDIAWRTIALTFHPLILWAAISGLPLSWPVGISFTLAPLLVAPPYNFSPAATGNMFIAAWVGGSLALIAGATLDWFVMRLTRRNRNVYEPEFRLWYTIPAAISFVIGFIGWGWGAQIAMPWVGLAVMLALIYFGAVLLNTAIISYIIDAYRMYAVESQVILFAFKNFFPFGMGYFFVEWYLTSGPKTVFAIVGGVCTGIALLAIPVYVFGKRFREYYMRHPFLGIQDMHG